VRIFVTGIEMVKGRSQAVQRISRIDDGLQLRAVNSGDKVRPSRQFC
jgi:hypothetical protein